MDIGTEDDAASFVLYLDISRSSSCVGYLPPYPVLQFDLEKLVGIAWRPWRILACHEGQGRLPLEVDHV